MPDADAHHAATTFRVATLNLDHFDDDRSERLHAAAAEIRRHDSDVVLVQEVSTLDGVDTAGILAERGGYQVAVLTPGGNAILTRLAHRDAGVVSLGHADAAAATVDAGCHQYLVVSTHLSWGSGRESVRLDEARRLESWVAERAPLDPQRSGDPGALHAVLGGDLNSEPDTVTLRWLRGLDVLEDNSTLWVDAWSAAGRGPGYTSTPENPYSARTAAAVGITRPELLPDRRIDYLLTRGYAHGRAGAALHAEILGRGDRRSFGDHYGVGATLLC